MRGIPTAATVLAVVIACGASAADPLPSWRAGPTREAIVGFVERVTTAGSADFVAPAERIAVFDNDGTLWAEQPMYVQAYFVLDRVRQLAPLHPEWATTEPFASVLKGDLEQALAGGEQALLAMVAATHAGMTAEEFDRIVADWIATARHPATQRLHTEMAYRPMQELLELLRSAGFKTYIVSGGGIDFIRPWAERVYGIPPEQVIGSRLATKYEFRDGRPAIVRLPELGFLDDREGKPVAIWQHIGRRPLMAFGNSDGDLQMLEWTTSGAKPGFAAIVRHTDEEREYRYDRESHVGRLDKALDLGERCGWTIVDMRHDWKVIYDFEVSIE